MEIRWISNGGNNFVFFLKTLGGLSSQVSSKIMELNLVTIDLNTELPYVLENLKNVEGLGNFGEKVNI